MDNRAGEMQVFVTVVEAGSFSAAARRLLMTPSTVSKLVARLEERLGVRLVERTTRQLSLTSEGQFYHERAQRVLSEIEDVERELAVGTAGATGTVRINASVAFGTIAIEPLLPAFRQEHPNIVVDLSLSDQMTDLYLERTDIAFRVGGLSDASLIAQKSRRWQRKDDGSDPRKQLCCAAHLLLHVQTNDDQHVELRRGVD